MNNTRLDNLDKMMDDYVYGLLEGRQAERIRRKIEEDPEWQLSYENAIERKRLVTGMVRVETSKAPSASFTAAQAIAAAEGIYGGRLRRRRIMRWCSGVTAAAAALLISVMWIFYAAISPPTHNVRLVGQAELISGSTVALKAIITDFDNRPSPDVPVNLVLTGGKAPAKIILASWRTDDNGVASGQVSLPAWEGDYKITAQAGSNRFQLVGAPIELKRASKVFLATDKPIYQPGQTIHMRTLVLQKGSLKPDAGRPVELTVTDPANNVIFRETQKLSEYGLAWVDLALDSLITPGRYRIVAAAGSDESKQTVEISHYKLPAFSVKIKTDKPYYRPGETLSGKVHLQYNFGKPVKGGKVKLQLIDRVLGTAHTAGDITVTAGASGTAGFEIPLPKTLFNWRGSRQSMQLLLSAQVSDPAGQENTGFRTIPVSPTDIRIAAVAEIGSGVREEPGKLFVVTSYPDGRPAKTIVVIRGLGQSVRTDETGVAVIESALLPKTLNISARDESGRTGQLSIQTPQAAESSLVLRTDKPIYTGGETIGVQVLGGKVDHVFIDVVKDRQTVLTQSVKMLNGRGSAAIDIPPMLSGTFRLHAYRLDAQGQWIGQDAIVIIKQAGGLKIAVSSDKKVHRPGQDAKLDFLVTDAAGKPQAAAISLAGVDEAVFSLQQAAPGLEGLMNGLDEELLIPAVEVHGLSMALMHESMPYAQAVLTAAANEAGKRDRNNAQAKTSDAALHSLDVDNKSVAMAAFHSARKEAKSSASAVSYWGVFGLAAALMFFGVSFVSAFTELTVTKRINWPAAVIVVIGMSILGTVVIGNTRMMMGPAETKEQVPRADGSLAPPPATEAVPLMTLVAPRTPAAALDIAPGKIIGVADPNTGGPTMKPDTATPTDGDTPKPVRTRTYFPETMLWRPQIITDPQGRANITVPLADSITTWRLSGSAVSKTGRLGRVSASVKVFQPFFVDVNAPTDLTRGDEASLPLVLYNYADKPLTVRLKFTGENGLALLSDDEDEVTIDPGEVTRMMVRVQADTIGSGTLKVLAESKDFSDSIRRDVRISPPGRPASAVVNGTLIDGQQLINVPIPTDAVEGSVALRLKLYPSTFSELMDGLEGVFRQPHGCFEQTSSTTYPNVMALSYMRANNLDNPEAALKATRYIQMGYQRLLSFEIKGGGFDWFGRGPANVVLTAYGLMEFADMAKVHNVDPKLLERTAAWLASQQNGQGAWRFRSGCFHEPFTGGDNSELAITAYITWAIASYKPDHPAAQAGATYIAAHTGDISNDYTLALCANALKTAGATGADSLIAKLAEKAQTIEADQACWKAGNKSNNIRATALAILAMRGDKQHGGLVNNALRWLASQRDPRGTWGATQSTIMALKALTQGTSNSAGKRNQDADLSIRAVGSDNPPVLMNVAAEASDAVHTAIIEPPPARGPMQLEIDAKGAAGLPYQIVIHYYTQTPPTRAQAPVQIRVKYDRTKLQVGQTVTARASITNTSSATANMLLADVGTPPAFSVDIASLEKLRASGKIERYTVTSHGVIFYITKLSGRATLSLEYKMTAKIPMKAQAAPTTVYPYYKPQQLAAAASTTFVVR
jgi:alpha-2-macroglobulin-like protein